MHLPKFEYFRPASLEEATHLLEEHRPQAKLVAGGTDLFPRMKYGISHHEVVVGLRGIPVRAPKVNQKGDLHLDALMSLADVARSPTILKQAPLLREAALSVGSNQIRHMGTLGGNLCLENRCLYYNQTHTFQFTEPCLKRGGDRCYLVSKGKRCWAVFTGDTASALISLGAMVKINGPDSSRRVSIEKLYTAEPLSPLDLTSHEILTEVIVPIDGHSRGTAFVKFSLRQGVEFALVTVAVSLKMQNHGIACSEARITVGAISTAPMRMVKAEEAMTERSPSKKLLERVAQMVSAEARLCPRPGFSATYLRECLQVQTLRALSLAGERLLGHREAR